MREIGISNDRLVYYLNLENLENWDDLLPQDNWLALLLNDSSEINSIVPIAGKIIDKKVNFVCIVGHDCEQIHDIFDRVIIEKRIKNGLSIASPDDFLDEPLTTWDENLENGLWFSIMCAYHDYKQIENIVCIDISKSGRENELIRIFRLISAGWIPNE
ncbi:MAG: hypothetical protein IPJ37_17445 [Bacteroidales bacterium]|nr:hypothetical protein [Bacteroidales bacterium]